MSINKKLIIKLIIIFTIFAILLLGAIIIIKYFYSKSYILSLLDKGRKNVNYIEKTEDHIKYVNYNKEKINYSNGNILYYDYDKKESIFINIESKTIDIQKLPNESYGSCEAKYNSLKNKKITRKDNENISGMECVVADFYNEDSEKYLMTRLWINKKLGTIEKIANYNVVYKKEKILSEEVLNMHTGGVDINNIEEPNLKDYSNFRINRTETTNNQRYQ